MNKVHVPLLGVKKSDKNIASLNKKLQSFHFIHAIIAFKHVLRQAITFAASLN